jgi:hypothetical protein
LKSIWFLIEVALLVTATQFILGPFVLYRATRHLAKPRFESFDPLNPPLQLPPSYAQNISRLEALGFQLVAHLFLAANSTRVRCVLTLLTNPEQKDRAMVVHILAAAPPVTRVVSNYVEFYTHFADGSEVDTNNSRQPAGFVAVPEKKIYRVPHLTDVKRMYTLHRALLAQQPAREKFLSAAGAEVSSLITVMESDYAREASFGRLRLDESGVWYRLTVKGAIISTLKFGWPVGQLRRLLQYSSGKRLEHSVFEGSSLISSVIS